MHGLLLDIQTGQLEWLVNGYQTLAAATAQFAPAVKPTTPAMQTALASQVHPIGGTKSPGTEIGAAAALTAPTGPWLQEAKIVPRPAPEAASQPRMDKPKPPPIPAPQPRRAPRR